MNNYINKLVLVHRTKKLSGPLLLDNTITYFHKTTVDPDQAALTRAA